MLCIQSGRAAAQLGLSLVSSNIAPIAQRRRVFWKDVAGIGPNQTRLCEVGRSFSSASEARKEGQGKNPEATDDSKRSHWMQELHPNTAETPGSTSVPQHSSSVEVYKSGEVDDSIQAILARSQRKDLIQKFGSRAAERYLPAEDPTALLLPSNRLEPSERVWQKVFVALPWAVFACMLAAPLLLVRGNLPFLQQRAEAEREVLSRRTAAAIVDRVPDFQVVNFGQMLDVLARPFPTILLLFDSATLASKIYLPAFRDLEGLLRKSNIPVGVAALDLSASPKPPERFQWKYPSAMSPHIQLILPKAKDGEAGVVDYEGRWSARALGAAARRIAGPHGSPLVEEELGFLDDRIERLRDLLFEMLFVEDGSERKTIQKKASWWRTAKQPSLEEVTEAEIASSAARFQVLQQLEGQINLHHGIEVAIESCEKSLSEFRSLQDPS